jgi:hypothetical protein
MAGSESPEKSGSGASGSPSENQSEPRSDSVVEVDLEATLSSDSKASSSSTADSEEGSEEALGFPAHQLQRLNEGLNRGSWVVHINCLVDCERAAAALIRHPDRRVICLPAESCIHASTPPSVSQGHQTYLASVRECASGATDIQQTVTHASLLTFVAKPLQKQRCCVTLPCSW